MKRYNLHAVVDMAKMMDSPTGGWVRFDDAWPRIAEAQQRTHRVRLELAEAQRQLDEVTRERDLYKAACALADALRNHERGV